MMARMAADSGVTAIAATPHCNIPGQFDNYVTPELGERFLLLRALLEEADIPLKLYTGMEVFVTEEVPRLLRQKKLLTMGGSRYLLVEFDFDGSLRFADRMLGEIRAEGVIPVIAHPERYRFVQADPGCLRHWADLGYALQINKGSLLGRFGRQAARAAHWCLGEGCVHLIGSDAHSPYRRTTQMSGVWEYVADFTSPEIADFLLRDNPGRVLEDRQIRPVLAEF